MFRGRGKRLCVLLRHLLLGWLLTVAIRGNQSVVVHGIQTTLPRHRAYWVTSGPLAQLTPPTVSNTPVSIVVHTYWGPNSCFNGKIQLDGSIEDTGRSIKHKLAAMTGVPVSLQKLYLGQSAGSLDSRITLGDRERVAEYQALLRLRHDTKQWQLDLLLELPVPLPTNIKPDPQHREEYIAALRRYSSLLSKVQEARKDPKAITTPVPVEPEEASCSINEQVQAIAKPVDEQPKNQFILPNRKIHLLYFYDMPEGEKTFKGHVSRWFKRQFPIDWMTHLKFAALCYTIRATCDNEPWVKELLLYSPPLLFLSQTRPGTLLWRSVLHALPTRLLPKAITNVLPVHVSEQLSQS